ncbi:MAG: phage head morphogenesis protein [Gammaproteobacteria bacterium]|nr:phage head morphogenesis protein [Gammaproteobacteria bacterium]
MAERDNQRRFNEVARGLEPAAQQAFVDSWQFIVNSVSLPALERAITQGGTPAAVRLLATTRESFDLFGSSIQTSFVAGGQMAFNTIPVRQNSPEGTRVNRTFAGGRDEDLAQVAAQIDRVVNEIAPTTNKVVQNTLNNPFSRQFSLDERMEQLVGKLNRATGNREGGVLGLTDRDARTIQSVDEGFRTGDKKRIASYFELDGRDIGLDTEIRKALERSDIISDTLRAKIRRMHANRLLAKRGLVFARAEVYNGVQAGRITGYQRIVEMGIVEEDSTTKTWQAFIDGTTRASHVAIDGTTIPMDGVFTLQGGDRMNQPRDASLGASLANIVNCRCYVGFNLKYLDL